ncbi:hypothetical protein [Rosenbergiella collisarenosi]|uniref:hypothetical protein n=1 Tax=Rosenbergiella collisarenosi TaxID=1544695 RepID=UPI001F4D4655|nr:hypothetical protein [Rosenbergiella collisarenosi]
MPDNFIALKYGTHSIERVLSELPFADAEPIIRQQIREELESSIAEEYQERIDDAEQEAWDQESRADELDGDIKGMAELVTKAMSSGSLPECLDVLKEIRDYYAEYF